MLNALTIDVEDYFQVHAFSDVIKFEDWGNYECRIERNADRLLSILSDSPIKNGGTAAQQHFSASSQDHSSTSALKNGSELLKKLPSPQHLVTHSLNTSLTQRVKANFLRSGLDRRAISGSGSKNSTSGS